MTIAAVAGDICILGQKRHLDSACTSACSCDYLRPTPNVLPFPPPTTNSSTSSADTSHSSLPHFEDVGVRNTPLIVDRYLGTHTVSNNDISSAWRIHSPVLVVVEETKAVVVLSRPGATGE